MTPQAYDQIVCSELPDKVDDSYLYSLVVKHMMHLPCGDLNPNNVCMREGKCKNHYPKNFPDYTTHGKTNYIPTIVAKMMAGQHKAIKYLYKYVHKGHDKVMFRIASNNPGSDIDEISNFQNTCWVSPVEAAWKIYGFPLHGMYPTVHLPNFQTVQFEEDADLEEFLRDERLKRTMLTGFF
ncbi:hypothetical protein LIER_28525 [Lithospermum erythrorhizon]|uniref:Helitron helicase-like domain-containing protein n=1 Tax=Lithospermum erythrorhizon TaxID=34254 RepID=A0AAV3RHN8_LITER